MSDKKYNFCIEYACPLQKDLTVFGAEGSWLVQLAKLFASKGHNVDILCQQNIDYQESFISNIRLSNIQTERFFNYDIYICGGWGNLIQPEIKAKLKICCMFFVEHIDYGRIYWLDILKQDNWVIVYPFDIPIYNDFFKTNRNCFAYKSFPLPTPQIPNFNISKNNFDSNSFLFTGLPIENEEKSIRQIKDYLINDLNLKLLQTDCNRPHYVNGKAQKPINISFDELLLALSNSKLTCNLNISGAWVEAIGSGSIPIFVYPSISKIETGAMYQLIPHRRKAVELEAYLEYPIDISKFKSIVGDIVNNKDRYLEVLSGYRELIIPNIFENSYKYFLDICSKYL